MSVILPLLDNPQAQLRLTALQHSGNWRTRFAPAPTGHLHLGHVVNALHVWGIARAFGGQVVLRIEDHDRTRSRPEYEASILDDLAWLGLEPDAGTFGEYRAGSTDFRQSDNTSRYADALAHLASVAHLYRCRCSRRDIVAVAGQSENEEARYPGTCRTQNVDARETLARRVQLGDDSESFDDVRLGRILQKPAQQCGDLLVRDRLGQWTYQFAVVVDDMAHDVDLVIRGEDLVESTGRQCQLARLLGRTVPPMFLHHSLVRHPDGTKLSKSSGDTAIHELRAQGCTAADIFGMAAHAVALIPSNRPVPADELPALFRHD